MESVWRIYGDPARLPVQPEGRSAALVIPLPTEGFGFAFSGQVLVHQPHRGRAVTDGGGNPLDRPVAGVSYCQNTAAGISTLDFSGGISLIEVAYRHATQALVASGLVGGSG
jgi:hypothetical protein